MAGDRVHYDPIAPTYHQRYAANPLSGVAAALRSQAEAMGAQWVLEVGCGTGRWLSELQAMTRHVVGLDQSLGMLRQAHGRQPDLALTGGQAEALPFPNGHFDLVYCVNAFHHFGQPQRFLAEARRLLRSCGALVIIGMDPHDDQTRYYLYDYFAGTRETDLRRFPAFAALRDDLLAAGFRRVDRRLAERIVHQFTGREVLTDPFLSKHATSQLVLLSDAVYAAGLKRIRLALDLAEAQGETLTFSVDIPLMMITAWV